MGGDYKVAKSSREVSQKRRRPPATSPEARENQLISLAVDLAEEQLLNGTASAQVITHYLKLGTTRASLEREKLVRENALLAAKTENLQSQKRYEELFENAIKAMKSYSGSSEESDEDPEIF